MLGPIDRSLRAEQVATIDTAELVAALESHSQVLVAQGMEVSPAVVEPPATSHEIEQAEAAVGLELPASFRATLRTVSRSVHWSWMSPSGGKFPEPFTDIFSGGLEWSISGLLQAHEGYLGWTENCFADPDDPYDAVWHHKVGFSAVPNGDVLAVDLAPDRAGAIVYLSHDDGEGHGYMLAHSLSDLLDRWVPLGCPGPEDWQWLPFVTYDFGPIDPSSGNGERWRSLLGLEAAPLRTPPGGPDDELFDSLIGIYQDSPDARMTALRALRVCSADRASVVMELLRSEDPAVQEAAAKRLGSWGLEAAVHDLKSVAMHGTHNGRIAAIVALRQIPGNAAMRAIEELRAALGQEWAVWLGRSSADDHSGPSQ